MKNQHNEKIQAMFSNKNIFKYCSKYFFFSLFTVIAWDGAGKLCTARDTFSNLIGSTLFAGLVLTWVLVLKSDVTKLIKNLSDASEEKSEN